MHSALPPKADISQLYSITSSAMHRTPGGTGIGAPHCFRSNRFDGRDDELDARLGFEVSELRLDGAACSGGDNGRQLNVRFVPKADISWEMTCVKQKKRLAALFPKFNWAVPL